MTEMNEAAIFECCRKVWQSEADSLACLIKMMDPDGLAAVVKLLANCKANKSRILTTGVGTSGAAAKKIAHTLSCIEIPAFFLSPADGVHGALGALQPGDTLIAISKGGGTEEIIKILPAIKSKGAKLIGVTENESSKLAQASDLLLKVRVEKEPDPFNMLATASTLAVIAVFDAIAVVLMEYTGYTKEQFLVIHPGGAVGQRLLHQKGGINTK